MEKKLLFGWDVTDSETEDFECFDGKPLIARMLPEEMRNRHEQTDIEGVQAEKRGRLPKALRIVKYVSGLLAALFSAGILRADVTLAQAYRNAPGLFYITGGLALAFAALSLESWRRRRAYANDPKTKELNGRSEREKEEARSFLGVPQEAWDMDALMCRYKRKDGGMRVLRTMGDTVYVNFSFRAWLENGRLCLADDAMRLEIPLSAFAGAEMRKEKFRISGWNKADSPEEGSYTEWFSNTEFLMVKRYLAVTLSCRETEYEMRVPPWEKKTLAALTGWQLPE